MSIRPIDLQTLFMHMNQVGKEQAQHREGVLLQQATMGSELVQESEHADSSVNQTQATSEGPEEVHEDEERSGGRRRRRKKRQGESAEDPHNESKYYKDPDLGNNIDITG